MFQKGNSRQQCAHRTNHQIRIPQIRVVHNGKQLGIMPTYQALRMAQDEDLDLVEIAPTARPPVCHIMDYGKFRFDESIRIKQNNKKQKQSIVQDKEIRLSPVITNHDIETKANQARQFIADGKPVQFVLKFKGRLIVHNERGFEVIQYITTMLEDIANIDTMPRMEGKTILCRLIPKKETK